MMGVKEYEVRNGRNKYHLIPYVGNKSGFAHIFDELVPDSAGDRSIVDVFGGSGAFSIYCCFRFGSECVTYNDNNPVLVNFMLNVRDNAAEIAELYENHRAKSGAEYYYEQRDLDILEGVDGAGRFLYLAKNAFSGKIRFNKSGKFNSPIRKNSNCPSLDAERFFGISRAVRHIKVNNRRFGEYSNLRDSFLYLDPPYMENGNAHYNEVPDTGEFSDFVRSVSPHNMVMISEQNRPEDIGMPPEFTAYDVRLRRSLQYNTRSNSDEIIALNYAEIL